MPQLKHLVIDEFMGEVAADALLSQIIASVTRFAPAKIRHPGRTGEIDPAARSALRLPGRIGVELGAIKAAIHERFGDLCAATGIAEFDIFRTEFSVVAHGDGDFYRRHIDISTGDPSLRSQQVRVLSCVYYMNQRPQAFSGGELVLYPLGPASEPARIMPQHDRLAVFPSFIPHEVLPITCPSGAFGDSRFSINCWLHRAMAQ